MMPWQGDTGLKPFKLQTPFGKAASGRPKGQPRLLKIDDESTAGFDFGMKFDGSSLTQSHNDALKKQQMPANLTSKYTNRLVPKSMDVGRRENISRGFGKRITKGRI